MNKKIENNLLPASVNLKEVLARLNSGVRGAVFIADVNHQVMGMFTDGDVRRALLNGASMHDLASKHMNKEFVKGSAASPRIDNLALLNEKIRHVPVLDDDGRLVDMLSWTEMLNLPLMTPSLAGNELKYLNDCIVSGWISSQGGYVKKFEQLFSDMHDGYSSMAVSSGTAALHLALKALGISAGDEVIVPDLTFAATANVVVHCGARPVCIDVDATTWTMDVTKIESSITDKTRAIIPVHLYGHPCDMDPVMDIARKYNLSVIEDCAEAQGSTYKGRMVGTIGDIGCFSFFSNKVITTGEGGMVMTRNNDLAEQALLYRDHGMSRERRYWHDVAGFNYRMTNLQAAVGVAQLERLDQFVSRRREIGRRYVQGLQGITGLSMPPDLEWASTIYWIFSMLVDENQAGISRDSLISRLSECGIETRPFFYPLHVQQPFKQEGDFAVADRLSLQGISLPSGNDISDHDIDSVCAEIKKIINLKN